MKYLFALMFCLLPLCGIAGEAKDLAQDPVLEKRMLGLAEKLRCLVCQNESLASSRSDLAQDLRRELREQLSTGKNDEQIIDYLVDRYGDFVLYDPRLKTKTFLLWFGPFLLMGIGVVFLVLQLKKRKRTLAQKDDDLSPEAAERVAKLLNQ
ncbi:MAG: cytochrome c-type biogenesis protein [Pseudomonadota bacterium]